MSNSVGIILIGRNNHSKRSDVLVRVATALEREGFAVQWFISDRLSAAAQIDKKLVRFSPAIATSVHRRDGLWRWVLRRVVKSILVLSRKERWKFVGALFRPEPFTTAQELGLFLDRLPFEKVHLLTHSAGGIAATRSWENAKVASICCFGYPFKHPERPPEPYRTRHLAKVAKPLVIMQGTHDEYGPPSPELEALLPLHARIVALESDHDCAAISAEAFETVLPVVRKLIGDAS